MTDLLQQAAEILAEDAPPPSAGPDIAGSIRNIPVTVQVVLGTARLPIGTVAGLVPGATISLEQKLGAPVTILVNGREVARGELFVLDGEMDRLGVTITELAPAGLIG